MSINLSKKNDVNTFFLFFFCGILGMASSASGYSALTYALSKCFPIKDDSEDLISLSKIARVGSGSASR